MSTASVIAAVLIAALLGGGGHVSAQFGPSPSPDSVPVSHGPSEPAPAPAPDCLTNLLNMSDCLAYVQAGGGGASKPDKACCPELAGLVESAPQCLCSLLGGNVAEQYGVKIDMAKALKLPAVCGVETPPPSLCSLFGIPVAAPAANDESSAISPTSSAIPPGAQTPTPEGFAASSATGDRKNDATRTAGSIVIMILTVFLSFF